MAAGAGPLLPLPAPLFEEIAAQPGIINLDSLGTPSAFKRDITGNVSWMVSFLVSDPEEGSVDIVCYRYMFEMKVPYRAVVHVNALHI